MKANKQIKEGKEEIQKVMQSNLASIAGAMIAKIMKNAKNLKPSQIQNAIKDIKPMGLNAYKSDLKATLAVISSLAFDQVRKEVPSKSKVKLMENEERLLFGEFEKLPPNIRKRINTANQLLIGTQISDLEKAIFFQFNSSVGSEKSLREIEYDMTEKAESYIKSGTITAGSSVVAANIVNEARNAFFFNDEVLEEVEAFQFMNGDPVSEVCNDLAGTIFSKNDPDFFKYTPPLHYNCKSWIRPILKLNKNQKIEKLKPSTSKIEATIQFSDFAEAASHDCQCKNHLHL